MCGIAGIVDTGSAPGTDAIGAMIACIANRGPDGAGNVCFETDGVALGHRRLSIIDLSAAAAQPMASHDGRYWVVFNGEIYNYLEVRSALRDLGWRFRTSSDTEVLLCAYEQWGAECLQRFVGMYAFAIWDRTERRLFAARDRLGIKPFYYQPTPTGLLFASEIKSILAAAQKSPGVDITLIDAYMEFGYVPGEDTLHAGVRRLLPGHTLTWQAGRITVRPYWALEFGAATDEGIEIWAERIGALLRHSIGLHLRSDVPVGVFLSGGLDSSAVVALLSREVAAGVKTFSVSYDFGPMYDESSYARQVAEAFGTEHREIRLTPAQFQPYIPQYVWHMDEPVTEAAAISLWHVSRLARDHVVVCLSGEGADELFAGYDLYAYNIAIERARRLLGGGVFAGLGAITSRLRRLAKLSKYLSLASLSFEQRYRGISSYEAAGKAELYDGCFGRLVAGGSRVAGFVERLFAHTRDWDLLSRMLYFDTRTWLVDDLLIKADRMSMAASIELRVPFLDHRVVENAAAMPSRYKIRGMQKKLVLKRALRGILADRIVTRRKLGFPTPLEAMFRTHLYDYAHDLILSRRAVERGYFDPRSVRRLLHEHRSGRAARHREIWQLVVLEEWHRCFGY